MDVMLTQAIIPLGATIVGAIVSMVATVITLRGTLGNQLRLEEEKFRYQQRLESERRAHEASAFLRKVNRDLQRLHNTARLDQKARVLVPAWQRQTNELEHTLESDECARSLNDAQFESAWRVCGESKSAMMFLTIWASQSNVSPKVVILSLREYWNALRHCFQDIGDHGRVLEVPGPEADFKGIGFWMTEDFQQPAVVPNP